ncbi:MAG: hypothetical protein GWO41_17550, partial [candidate division Zixibacteria bacterium]|nr:hypothetical protein [candidate division Zixibacteria bacterium]NIR66515.1 hypothetical protein [candidate division Zixibacteria bacterium]NIS48085.1 hypothetical protein [candidate division Zixibacteria bacterium]NIT54497.1 hypothetical protein [candidate division Zixibacteria bacterium]NIU16203.1 hypothetical protein [candidate division Zixibacteria bacterium]
RQRKRAELSEPFSPYGATAFGKALEVLKESVYGGKYRTFLVQAPSTVAELSFAVEAAKKIDGNIIISAPEHGWIDHIEGALREAVGETALVSYHAGINAGKRSESL